MHFLIDFLPLSKFLNSSNTSSSSSWNLIPSKHTLKFDLFDTWLRVYSAILQKISTQGAVVVR